ncbi:ABC transporter substrate-binding protein [Anaeromicropila herbilytica]|uniref:ABC transporter substrate-binding protein n=1 Tax=Anaeromicropila herbilytica TaxID=2785025 RepID=A0A7R7IG36_9FIRM|nr:ABC transporter substrate-binding protein [Anaeromicropila herbilytica]BCN32678.1 ABC transporter substrate-binding protein [Anaeromicropila herbilytica]
MRKIKKAVSVLLVGTMIASSLVGCSNKKSTSDSKDSSSKKSVEITMLNSKGEIQEGLEAIAEKYKEKTGVSIEVIACGAGESPFQKISTMYSAGNPPTLAILDTTDVKAIAEEKATDLSSEKWVQEMNGMTTDVNGKIYSFPLCIEGRGIIYNKTAIEKTLGKDFDPSTINSYDSLKAIFDKLKAKGMKYPIVISKEDWSLGAHQLQYVYETQTGDNAGAQAYIDKLKAGESIADNKRFDEFIKTFDLLKENNINNPDPLAATYEQDPIFLADGDAAFWFNGSWAWPNIKEAGGDKNEYGFIPYVLGNDTSDFANTKIQASPSKQVMIDKEKATPEQVQAAKDFLNYLVYDEQGQKALVDDCSIIPVAKNNPNAPSDPLGKSIKDAMGKDGIFTASAIVPGDHWSVLGAEMQKYLAGQSTKEELAKAIDSYWAAQK